MKEIRGIVLPWPTAVPMKSLCREHYSHSQSLSAACRSFRPDDLLRGHVFARVGRKMYPRWQSKPLGLDAYHEMRDLFTELKIIDALAAARRA